ncbi:MAG TPA: hypothetical protein VFV48_00335, partial [Pseudomonadales bacterium]|nr:hypothetical protein [Pseudomonadales bacterium]
MFHFEFVVLYLAAGLAGWYFSTKFRKMQPVGRIVLVYFLLHIVQVLMTLPYLKYGVYNSRDWPVLQNVPACFLFSIAQIVLMISTTLWVIRKQPSPLENNNLEKLIGDINVSKVILFTFILTAVTTFFQILFGSNASVMQLILIASSFLQTSALVVVTLVIVAGRQTGGNKYLAIAFMVIGFFLSFFSYFSSFRVYFLVVFLTVAFFGGSLIRKLWLPITTLGLLGFIVLVFWSSVKNEYRALLSGGQRAQVVTVDRGNALNFLKDKATSFDQNQFTSGLDQLLYRMQYLEIYTKVVDKIPKDMDHLRGDNLISTLEFLFLPRALNPSKRVLDPSAKVNRFT